MLETFLRYLGTTLKTLIIPKAIEAVGKKVGDTTFDKTANFFQIIKEKFTATGTANLLEKVEENPSERNIQELQKELILQKVSPSYCNLPQPDYGKFIGRESEKQKIFTKLRPYPHSTNSVITIDGIGGIGKSALALEVSLYFLREYPNLPVEEQFDAIIWTSAKRNALRADRGIVDKRQALKTLDDLCQTIAKTLNIEQSIRSQAEDNLQLVLRALTQQRTLLIIDNFETIDDESVNEFIQDLLPVPTKVIVTTRHRINVAYPIPLRGMPWEDGKLLIEYECDKKEVSLDDEQIRKLYDRTGGVPLAIVWTIAKLRFGSKIDTVLARLGNIKGDIARFCFEEVIDGIKGKDSYKLLLALALDKWSMSREKSGNVAGFAEDELSRDDGLEELQILSLVNKDKDQFSLLPLTKEYIEQQFKFNREFIGESVCRLMKYNENSANKEAVLLSLNELLNNELLNNEINEEIKAKIHQEIEKVTLTIVVSHKFETL